MILIDLQKAFDTIDHNADDSCLLFADRNFDNIENNLNINFNLLCDWFVDNNLSISGVGYSTYYVRNPCKATVFPTPYPIFKR